MKFLVLFLAICLSANTLYAKTLIVSDVDDTIKVTDVLNKKNAIYNALFSKAAFSGMPELYRQLENSETLFFYISGSPKMIEEKVSNFLDFNNFPQRANLILKQGISSPTYDFKVAAITKLIQAENPDKVILIGDDTEFDPEVYQTISKSFPNKVESIYIRAIQDRQLPKMEMMKNFFSSVEIAGFEMLKGNLKIKALSDVSASFIRKDNGSKIVINGRFCPSQGRAQIEELKQLAVDQSAINSLELTQQKIISTCTK